MIYRNMMAVLKEVTMGQVEGDGNGVGHEQKEEYLILREQRNCGHRGNDKEWRKDANDSLRFSHGQERRLDEGWERNLRGWRSRMILKGNGRSS